MYDVYTGGNLLGSATVPEYSSEATIKITQLGTTAGNVFVSVSGNGKLESNRTLVYYSNEFTSDAPDANYIIVTNNIGKSDTVKVSNITADDMVKVYDLSTGGKLLGYGIVAEDASEVTVKITQLGTISGSIYVTVTSAGAIESNRTKINFSAE